MVKIDLITGFLGAGKTTFLKMYAKHLMEMGENICILENDFGAVNVDMMLLQDIMGDHCELEMVSGGCDADCHRRRFKTKLISMAMCGYDRVLVEPSGIYDVDEFFDVLREDPLDQWYEIENVIAIVDAKLDENMSDEAEFLLASQIANAGKILLSKVELATQKDMEHTINHLNHAMEKFQCRRRFSDEILCKEWKEFSEDDFVGISNSGFVSENYVKLWFDERQAFSSLYFMEVQMPEEMFYDTAKKLFEDASCGKIFRIKGFMKTPQGGWVELNAAKQNISLRPVEVGQEVFIVIGEDLVKERIAAYVEDNGSV
ncbi:MAG: GTPase (G3E family) [Lachnospiraceae bacterium]|nr:GTPase (G3E family) [Lachnospiraceae bacterium]